MKGLNDAEGLNDADDSVTVYSNKEMGAFLRLSAFCMRRPSLCKRHRAR